MTYNFDSDVDVQFDFDYLKIYREIVDKFLDIEECPYEVCVETLLTDDDGIKQINAEQRNIDAATDVLSFPMNDFPTPGDYLFLEDDLYAFEPESGELLLGDIVLSQDRIFKQAEEFGHSVLREYAFLIVHSLLHLTGYDHMEEEERNIMEERQRVIMNALGILR